MLLHTNFIAERLAARRAQSRRVRRALWSVVGSALVCLSPMFWLDGAASARNEQLLELRLERQRLAPRVAESIRFQRDLQQLAEPSQRVRRDHANNARWHDLLQELRDRLPEGIWLSALSVAPPAAAEGASPPAYTEVVLQGRAAGQEPIGQYLTELNKSPWIEVAVLNGSSPAPADEGGGTRFELRARLRQPVAEGDR